MVVHANSKNLFFFPSVTDQGSQILCRASASAGWIRLLPGIVFQFLSSMGRYHNYFCKAIVIG